MWEKVWFFEAGWIKEGREQRKREANRYGFGIIDMLRTSDLLYLHPPNDMTVLTLGFYVTPIFSP